MSLYSALRSGVSSLQAQTQAMSMVSHNISNLNTNGYKRTSASFSTLVNSGNNSTTFSAGSVISRPNLQATETGQITKSNSNTDLSINGQGFFPVAKAIDVVDVNGVYRNDGEVLYTRLGDFRRNQNGLLENSAGYVLLSWPRNAANNGYDQTSLESQLSPVAVTSTTGTPEATSSVNINANLSSNPDQLDYFSTTINIFDRQGTSHVAKLNFRRSTTEASTYDISMEMVDSNVAIKTKYNDDTNVLINGTPFKAPDLMSVLYDSEDRSKVYLNYDSPLINPTPAQVVELVKAYKVYYTDTEGGAQELDVLSMQVEGARVTLTLEEPIPGRDNDGVALHTDLYVTYDTSAITDPADRLQGMLINSENNTLFDNIDDPNYTTYEIDAIAAPSPTDTGAPMVDAYSLGTVTFAADGTTTAQSFRPSEEDINNIGGQSNGAFTFEVDYAGNGNALDFSGKSDNVLMSLNMLAQSGASGLTSYDAPHAVYSITQNGSSAGSFKELEISTTGEVSAAFSVGDNRLLAQIPIAVFSNANELEQVDGNAFRKTVNAGAVIIRTAGSSGAGSISSATLEASNVDLANEFTNMIVTQRAYSASTKIITTADEMLEELVRAKR